MLVVVAVSFVLSLLFEISVASRLVASLSFDFVAVLFFLSLYTLAYKYPATLSSLTTIHLPTLRFISN